MFHAILSIPSSFAGSGESNRAEDEHFHYWIVFALWILAERFWTKAGILFCSCFEFSNVQLHKFMIPAHNRWRLQQIVGKWCGWFHERRRAILGAAERHAIVVIADLDLGATFLGSYHCIGILLCMWLLYFWGLRLGQFQVKFSFYFCDMFRGAALQGPWAALQLESPTSLHITL